MKEKGKEKMAVTKGRWIIKPSTALSSWNFIPRGDLGAWEAEPGLTDTHKRVKGMVICISLCWAG